VDIDKDEREFDEKEDMIVIIEEEMMEIELMYDEWRML
jgi:hypothetical protein